MADNARKNALMILNRLDSGQDTLDNLVENVVMADRRDRALLNALVYGVLRWRARLDWIIAHFSKTPLVNIDPPILNILRLGLFQIMYLDRVPDSAAVNTSVEMAKSIAAIWTVRFVNGLLRNAIRHYKDVAYPDIEKNPASALSVNKSFPEWLIRRWLERFGTEETENLCDAMNAIAPLTLRVNTLKTKREALITEIRDDVEKAEITPYSPTGIFCINLKKPLSDMTTFQNGCFQVQDEAAQLAVYLLDPQPGEKILDACAGLGGKTVAIAQLMNDQGMIVASDKDARKLSRLDAEMTRLGVSIVKTSVQDLEKTPSSDEQFDKVLLDAPCSGLGVMRRNPDIKWAASKKNIKRYAQKQQVLLENSAVFVKPGGCLTYIVCSTEPEETDAVIHDFLSRHHEFEIKADCPAIVRPVVNELGYFRTFPHLHGTDGFFAVCLQKQNLLSHSHRIRANAFGESDLSQNQA
jgi:16S rRNA (cytosine967-C5)-methyltransferase